jgi:AcrB/AcrD/AcrF family
MAIFAAMGVASYINLGREEDPSFTIKTMLIQAQWPGASVDEMSKQVTERIERKLEELEALDYTKSMTTPGQTIVFVNLRDTTKGSDVHNVWLRVRNMIKDIRAEFPPGVTEPTFNDRFGDVFGNVYAFTADGLTQRQLRDYVERARREVLLIPNVGKVDLIGVQDEVIFADFRCDKSRRSVLMSRISCVRFRRRTRLSLPAWWKPTGADHSSCRRPVHFRGESALDQSARERPLLSPQRSRHHHTRLRRPSADALSREWRAGHRPRDRHEVRRQPSAFR